MILACVGSTQSCLRMCKCGHVERFMHHLRQGHRICWCLMPDKSVASTLHCTVQVVPLTLPYGLLRRCCSFKELLLLAAWMRMVRDPTATSVTPKQHPHPLTCLLAAQNATSSNASKATLNHTCSSEPQQRTREIGHSAFVQQKHVQRLPSSKSSHFGAKAHILVHMVLVRSAQHNTHPHSPRQPLPLFCTGISQLQPE